MTTKVFATVALLATVGASAARADFKDFNYRCNPGAIRACASLRVTTQVVGSQTNVVIRVRNLAGSFFADNTGGSLITRIGIVKPPITGTSVTNGVLNVSVTGGATINGTNPGSNWFLRDPGGLGSIIELTAGITATTQAGGIAGCGAPWGGYPASYFQTCGTGFVEFAFTTNNVWSANNSEVAWLTTSSANNNFAVECGSNDTTAPNGTHLREFCDTVTPEPITMVLLGSGLAGMGGFGFIRRRRNTDEQNG